MLPTVDDARKKVGILLARLSGYRTGIAAMILGIIGLRLGAVDRHEFWRDMAIALTVSGVIGSIIEFRAHARRERAAKNEERAKNIETVVLNQAMTQIGRIGTLGELFCPSWMVELDIEKKQIETPKGRKLRYVSTGTLTYTLVNMSLSEKSVILRHELECDVRGSDNGIDLPTIESLTYQTKSRAGASLQDMVTFEFPPPFSSGSLRFDARSGLVSSPGIVIPADAMIEVKIKRHEAVGRQFPWYMFWITGKAEVRVRSCGEHPLGFVLVERPTVSLHAEQCRDGEYHVFTIEDLLPGQGFAIFIDEAPFARTAGERH